MKWRVLIKNNGNLGTAYFRTKKEAMEYLPKVQNSSIYAGMPIRIEKKIGNEWFAI